MALLAELDRRGLLPTSEVSPISLADFSERFLQFKLHSWQRDHLCPLLERCLSEKGLRIAIHAPPQFGKSIITSQRFIAWLLGMDARHKTALMSFNESHSYEFGLVIKNLMLTPDYRDIFPSSGSRIKKDSSAGAFFTNARTAVGDGQPSFVALGLNSGMTGKGPDTIIIDDPYASTEEASSETINSKIIRLFDQTVLPRIGEEANIVVMFHRYHAQDIAQHCLDLGFEYFRFPAIADINIDNSDPTGREPGELLSPMRSSEWLESTKDNLGDEFYGLFQGVPKSPEGQFFKEEWFEVIEHCPRLKYWIRGWDLATSTRESGDWTTGALIGVDESGSIIIQDVNRFRLEWPDAHDEIIDTAQREKYPIGVDGTASQLGFVQHLGRSKDLEWIERIEDYILAVQKPQSGRVPMYSAQLRGDKKQRASGWAHVAKRHGVKLVKGIWNAEFMKEIKIFDGNPINKDDQVDAVSIAYDIARKLPNGKYSNANTPEIGSPVFWERMGSREKYRQGRRTY